MIMESLEKSIEIEVTQSQTAKTFYYLATCLLLLQILDRQHRTPAKGFHLYLYNVKRVFKLLLVRLFAEILKKKADT